MKDKMNILYRLRVTAIARGFQAERSRSLQAMALMSLAAPLLRDKLR